MAVDDVVNGLAEHAGAGDIDYQPAAGVEVVLIAFADTNGAAGSVLRITDGTNTPAFATTASILTTNYLNRAKVFITNSFYFRSGSDGIRDVYYSGIQTK